MAQLDWARISAQPWRDRNDAIEIAVRELLSRTPATLAFSTLELAVKLLPPGTAKAETGRLSQILSRMAPFLPGLATHDGEWIMRYGRRWRRWQWRGQVRGG